LVGASSQRKEYGEFFAMQEKYAPECIFFQRRFGAARRPKIKKFSPNTFDEKNSVAIRTRAEKRNAG
jgi:hypothetical protein